MAYKAKDLSILSYANGFTLWHYRTTDLEREVLSKGYFNDAADVLEVGHVAILNHTSIHTSMLAVTANTRGVVSIAGIGAG